MSNLSDLSSLAGGALPKKAARPIYTFKLPPSLAAECGTESVGLVQLTAGEELMASKRSAMDQIQLAYELAKEALREVDGKPVSTADLSADAWWDDQRNTKIRTLVVSAYNTINAPNAGETKDFLASCSIRVG